MQHQPRGTAHRPRRIEMQVRDSGAGPGVGSAEAMDIVTRTDGIFHVRDLIPADLCRACIDLYGQDAHKRPGHTTSAAGERQLETEVKVSTDLDVGTEGAWQPLFAALHAAVNTVIEHIVTEFSALRAAPLQCTGYKIQHYQRNVGHFKWHFDAIGPGGWERQLAMIIYLNTVADGGETCFHRQALRVKPVAGSALFFPPFWTHMHCGEVPRSEDKYIISSFVRFALPGIA
jgi:hypothetical protein